MKKKKGGGWEGREGGEGGRVGLVEGEVRGAAALEKFRCKSSVELGLYVVF